LSRTMTGIKTLLTLTTMVVVESEAGVVSCAWKGRQVSAQSKDDARAGWTFEIN
jgi:hypothetical protein